MCIPLSIIIAVSIVWMLGQARQPDDIGGVAPFGFWLVLGWIGAAVVARFSPGIAVVAGVILAVVTVIWLLARVWRRHGERGFWATVFVITVLTMALYQAY